MAEGPRERLLRRVRERAKHIGGGTPHAEGGGVSEIEQWVALPGYDHQYEVSSLGNVRRLRRIAKTYRPIAGGWAKGYRLVLLRRGGIRVGKTVHSLVLEAFVCPRPEGMQVRHLNGNKLDNRLVNLAWGTAQENADDRRVHGTVLFGERHKLSKLADAEADFIRSNAMQSICLARMFGVSVRTVTDIRSGRVRRIAT
jgi:HNH endonuclease/NUMOD4 motif